MWGNKKKKNKESAEEEAEFKDVNKAKFQVVLLDTIAGAPRYVTEFEAVRYRDDEDHVVYLKNDKKQFLEIFPEQIADFKNYTESEVDQLIKETQISLRRERVRDSEEINDKDLEMQLLKLQAKKRSFKFDTTASYVCNWKGGKPTFFFLRKGSNFLPYKWDSKTESIFVPSDNRKKSASIALRNKDTKYTKHKKLIEGGVILMLLVGFCMMMGGGYSWYKANQSHKELLQAYDETEIAKATQRSLQVAAQCADVSLKTNQKALDVINKAEEKINEPKTIIDGLLPEGLK